jgi:hypothetical protein
MITTIYVLFVLNGLGMSAFLLGVTYALSGIGSVLGATSSAWIGRRLQGAALHRPVRLRAVDRHRQSDRDGLPAVQHPGRSAGPDERDHAFNRGVGGMVVQALWLHLSKFRHARLSEADTGVTT